MNIGENIRRIRIEKHMTQKELGEKLGGISQQQIGRWENGDKNPKIETVIKIARALGVPVSYLNDSLGWLKEPKYMPLEKKLEQIGYTLGENEDGYLWINYPDGTLEVTMDELSSLESDTDSYLTFKLEELKKKNAKDFRPYKK
jgi:transcriptional regulator with XRE-family HTH domain|nr:helix-turn-helix transcriptional regulator [uncultured Acetatifactor sp.]